MKLPFIVLENLRATQLRWYNFYTRLLPVLKGTRADSPSSSSSSLRCCSLLLLLLLLLLPAP